MPTGLVKSTIHASGLLDAHAVGDVQHHGHRPQRLGQTAGTGGLLTHATAVQRPRLVTVSCRLATDPQLEQHRVRSVDRVVQAAGGAHRPRVALVGEDALRQTTDELQAVLPPGP